MTLIVAIGIIIMLVIMIYDKDTNAYDNKLSIFNQYIYVVTDCYIDNDNEICLNTELKYNKKKSKYEKFYWYEDEWRTYIEDPCKIDIIQYNEKYFMNQQVLDKYMKLCNEAKAIKNKMPSTFTYRNIN
jgi:hypothetical protein